ncbi:MAG: TlpA family protein disulfide reductase [Prevotella sp.]|nr:TlpA family protein disulfide reductase [Prevotella sp.]
MKKIFIIFALLLQCFAMSAQTRKPQISGNLYSPSDTLLFIWLDPATGQASKLDTIAIVNNSFEYNLPDPDKVYSVGILVKPAGQNPNELIAAMMNPIRLIAIPGEQAVVNGRIDNYTITGSQFYRDIQEVEPTYKAAEKEVNRCKRILQGLQAATNPGDYPRLYTDSMHMAQMEMSKAIFAYIKKYPNKKASASLVNVIRNEDRHEAADLLNPDVRNGVMAPYINAALALGDHELAQEAARKKTQAGMTAPIFTLKDMDGKDVNLTSFRGKYTVLDFWGSWCGYCIQGFPDMKASYAKYKDKIEFIGIDCQDTEEKWKSAVARYELPWVHVRNTSADDIPTMYAVTGYPTKVVIDPQGNILKTFAGESKEFYKYLDNLLSDI